MKDNAYRSAGVDIDAGDALVDRIKPLARRTARSGVMGGIGGFGALFDLKMAGFKDPVLVSSTDGVGTKLKIAIECGKHDTVGIDLVAMCVNDLIVQGAEPLFFLDYFASGKLDIDIAASVISGIATGCELAGCALIGGETAEMPGMYAPGDYDLAGFSVGAIERERLIDGSSIRTGDCIIGLPSSGAHSNGFSLIRKIVAAKKLHWHDPAPFDTKKTCAEAFLTPTKIYIRPLLRALALTSVDGHPSIKGMAHITGGGLIENIPRCLPTGLGVRLDKDKWMRPTVFSWLQKAGDLTEDDMSRTFNCGIGMIAVCAPEVAIDIIKALKGAGEEALLIGEVVEASGKHRVFSVP